MTLAASLSVVIPVKNDLIYLPKAIESIRRQNIDGTEIIVVDDQSTDGLDRWLADESRRHGDLKCLTGKGQGAGAARNLGLAEGAAPYVAFLDADDAWFDAAIADRLAVMRESSEILMTFGNAEHYLPDGQFLGTCFEYWPRFSRWLAGRSGLISLGKQAFRLLFVENVCGTDTVIIRRDVLERIGGFDPTLRIGEDWDLWLKVCRMGEVRCTTRPVSRRLRRTDSTSRNLPVLIECLKRVTAAHEHFADPRARAIAQARIETAKADLAELSGRPGEALLHRVRNLLLDPAKRSAWDTLATLYRLVARKALQPTRPP